MSDPQINIWKTSSGYMMISWVQRQDGVIDGTESSINWYADTIGVERQVIHDAYKAAEKQGTK